MSGPYTLTRNELAQFLPSARAIRAFEQLFEVSTTDFTQILEQIANIIEALALLSNRTDEVDADAGSAAARAQMAIDSLSQLANAVELLALAPAQFPQVQDVDITPPVINEVRRKRYGVFHSTLTQTAAAINTAYGMTLNATDISFGVYVGTPTSRVYLDTEGLYNFQFSAQLGKTGGGLGAVYIWIRINGIDIPDTATKIRIQGNNAECVAAWNFVLSVNSGDYFELMWSTDDTTCQIFASAASSPVPSIPSVILTVTDNIS